MGLSARRYFRLKERGKKEVNPRGRRGELQKGPGPLYIQLSTQISLLHSPPAYISFFSPSSLCSAVNSQEPTLTYSGWILTPDTPNYPSSPESHEQGIANRSGPSRYSNPGPPVTPAQAPSGSQRGLSASPLSHLSGLFPSYGLFCCLPKPSLRGRRSRKTLLPWPDSRS